MWGKGWHMEWAQRRVTEEEREGMVVRKQEWERREGGRHGEEQWI